MPIALVTGSAGFVGRHMVRELITRGYDVVRSDINHDTDPDTNGTFTSDCLNIFRNPFQTRIYDLVVHCAFHVGGRVAIGGINTHFLKNLQLDSAMFEWAVRTKQKRVLYFSSSAAYPIAHQGEVHPYDAFLWDSGNPVQNTYRLHEDDIHFNGNEPFSIVPDAEYGWAKLTGERMARNARNNGLSVTVVRPFSGYGEDQSLDYPFPSIIQRASQGDLSVWGPEGQCRDWIHISDVVRGALAVVESGTEDPVNLCTGIGMEMGQLAEMIWELKNRDLPVPAESPRRKPRYMTDQPTGVFYRVGDPTRSHQYYTPQVSLEEGILRALDT